MRCRALSDWMFSNFFFFSFGDGSVLSSNYLPLCSNHKWSVSASAPVGLGDLVLRTPPIIMSTQLARPHSHLSNRAKVRSALQRKPVFKSVLENPFQISWCVPFQTYGNTGPLNHPRPSVPVNVQNVVLARLVAALENIPPRTHASRKVSHKTERFGHQGNVDITEIDQTNPSRALDRACLDSSSGALPHLIIGINAVTKALEFQLRLTRKHVVVDGDQLPPCPAPSPIVVVFVCCADVDPTALIDHIPYLVAGCNSPRNVAQPIKLVPLPKGSEPTISQILGVRRAAVVAFRVGDYNCNWGSVTHALLNSTAWISIIRDSPGHPGLRSHC